MCLFAAVHFALGCVAVLFHPELSSAPPMSEHQVSRLLHRLGLWARRDIQIGQDGRILSGTIDPESELLYQQLFVLHDFVLEGAALSRAQQVFLDHCEQHLAQHRPAIAAIEREYA